jgi:hypothetical protein
VLAVALMTALAFRVHPADVLNELGKAEFYWVPALLAANLVSDWFRALRWQQLLPADRRPRVMLLFFSSHIGSAVNFLIPLRAGEAVRVRIVSQRTEIEPATLVATLFGEILSDLVIGLTCSDHFQPGSSVSLPTVPPPIFTSSTVPFSNFRVSSGDFRFFCSAFAMTSPPSVAPAGVPTMDQATACPPPSLRSTATIVRPLRVAGTLSVGSARLSRRQRSAGATLTCSSVLSFAQPGHKHR